MYFIVKKIWMIVYLDFVLLFLDVFCDDLIYYVWIEQGRSIFQVVEFVFGDFLKNMVYDFFVVCFWEIGNELNFIWFGNWFDDMGNCLGNVGLYMVLVVYFMIEDYVGIYILFF